MALGKAKWETPKNNKEKLLHAVHLDKMFHVEHYCDARTGLIQESFTSVPRGTFQNRFPTSMFHVEHFCGRWRRKQL